MDMASTQKDDVMCATALKDVGGSELIKTEFVPVGFSMSYTPIWNDTPEINTYY